MRATDLHCRIDEFINSVKKSDSDGSFVIYVTQKKLQNLKIFRKDFAGDYSAVYFRYTCVATPPTRLKCDGKYNDIFCFKFLAESAVKEFLKSVNIFQSYAEEWGYSFFSLTVYIYR